MRVEKENLWNETNKKTRKVIEYINELKGAYDEKWDRTKMENFNSIIREAQSKVTANDMLTVVGYRFNHNPAIFDKINGER